MFVLIFVRKRVWFGLKAGSNWLTSKSVGACLDAEAFGWLVPVLDAGQLPVETRVATRVGHAAAGRARGRRSASPRCGRRAVCVEVPGGMVDGVPQGRGRMHRRSWMCGPISLPYIRFFSSKLALLLLCSASPAGSMDCGGMVEEVVSLAEWRQRVSDGTVEP